MPERLGDKDPATEMYKGLESLGARTQDVEPSTLRKEMSDHFWDFDTNDFQTGFMLLLVYGILNLSLEGNFQLVGQLSQLNDPAFFRR